MNFRDLMFNLGWIHKDEVQKIAKDTVGKAYDIGRQKGMQEVMYASYRAALDEFKSEEVTKFFDDLKVKH